MRAHEPHHRAPKPGISVWEKHGLPKRQGPSPVLALCVQSKICANSCQLRSPPPCWALEFPSVRVAGDSGSGDLGGAATAWLQGRIDLVALRLQLAPRRQHRHDTDTSTHISPNPRRSSQWLPREARHLPGRMFFIPEVRMSSTSSQYSNRTLVSTSGEKALPRAAPGLFPARSTGRPLLTPASPLRSGTPLCGVR